MKTVALRGIFDATVKIATELTEDGSRIVVEIDGTTDATGMGEALGIAAAGWIGNTGGGLRRKMFEDMLAAFIATAAGGETVHRSGTAELHRIADGEAVREN